ncbi:MAG: bacterioferritin [Desulfovibrio sp.]|nr:bacterioferritin [Desulfovibrio sp.]
MSDDKSRVQNVIDALNKARSMELQAISQYMVQHYILDDLDYGQLCGWQKLISVDEMRHAEDFAERIEALGGNPTCDKAGPIAQPQTVEQIYPFDVNMEQNTVDTYDKLAEICRQNGDQASAALFDRIIQDELVHLQYYKDTTTHIEKLGDAFLAKYAATSKHSGPIKSFVKVMKKEDF